ATVYGIVQQSGGRIEVDSDLGLGTTFRIYLPPCHEPETPEDSEAMAEEVELEGSETILLVDDNAEFRDATRALLGALGYEVLLAADGAQALELFSERVDLVLTDVVMPEMSGTELVARLRQQRAVRAIFMSGYTEDVTRRHGLQAGDLHLIKKQFSSTSLARSVRQALDR
ncbi:MAG: response regulator, partial [Acidobacteriota bacterium]